MNYADSLSYLERLGNEVLTMKFGLETIRKVLRQLGDPHREYPSVLVTGTNGKGSVVRFLHQICRFSGLHGGLYTSPHLARIEERMVVGGEQATPEEFADCLSRTAQAIEQLVLPYHPTYFETVTAAAFLFFARRKVELAVLEIGMGGRLDSTNVVDPCLSVITPIGLDHQQFLGDTLEAIAAEKAGIIHAGRPVLTSAQKPPVLEVLRREAERKSSSLREAGEEGVKVMDSRDGRFVFSRSGSLYQLGVYGRHQVSNAALALACADELEAQGFPLTDHGRRQGIEQARVPGVLQKMGENPAVFLDGAHNPDAAAHLARFLEEFTKEPRSLVFGMMRDKNPAAVSRHLRPCFQRVYLTAPSSPRAAAAEELRAHFPEGVVSSSPLDALRRARGDGAETVVVSGSFYLVGEVCSKPAEAGK